jgi:glycosyltransferase involved in cell wall biosynthesis
MEKPTLIRITTVPMSLHYLLRGQLPFMQANGFKVLAVSADGPERKDILNEGIRHYIIPFTRKITPFQDLVCLFKLIRLFRKVKPAIVHTHTPKAGLLGMLAAWMCRVPVRLHTVAGMPVMEARGLTRIILKITERITYTCAHKVYPNSIGLMKYIQTEFKIQNSKFQILGKGSSNGIDSAYFSRSPELEEKAKKIRLRHQIPEKAVVLCFVGRIVKDKGIGELIAVFSRLSQNKKEVFLLLVGPMEPDLDPLMEEDVAFLRAETRVIMPGFQPDVCPWLMASDIFVFPSYREGFPNVVMQAACLGVPCVVSNINGCNEIITHGETGLLVKPKQEEALYQAVARLLEDEALQSAFKVKARDYVVQNFDQQVMWTALLNEYKKFLPDINSQADD